ncbi:glycosyltransferase [bacterium]|nr:glycosyltransferase [bacterium]
MLPTQRRIAYIHTQPFGAYEAGTVFVANTARGIAEAGAQSLLIAPDFGESADGVLEQIGLTPHPDLRIELPRGVRMELGPLRPSWSGPFRRGAIALAREFKADTVICRDLRMAKMLIADRYPGCVLYEMHNVYTLGEESAAEEYFSARKLKRHRSRIPLEKKVLAHVHGVITLTHGLGQMLAQRHPVEGRVLAAGSACRPLANPPIAADRRHIAYVGALDPHKGVGNLIRSLDRLPEEARLMVFGKGSGVDTLRDLAATHGVAERVEFAGFVKPAALPTHLARCRAGVVPLVDIFFNRYVSSPMKVFDYLASGVPPVVPDLPVFREIFEDSSPAVFFKAGDDDSMVAAIGSLFEDDATFRRRHLAALHHAAAWTWRHRAEKILDFSANLPLRPERKPQGPRSAR